MLSEIEQNLEDCRDTTGLQQETEALSLKLKEVKCNLEKVQVMLQDKYSEEQVKKHEHSAKTYWEELHAVPRNSCRTAYNTLRENKGRTKMNKNVRLAVSLVLSTI